MFFIGYLQEPGRRSFLKVAELTNKWRLNAKSPKTYFIGVISKPKQTLPNK